MAFEDFLVDPNKVAGGDWVNPGPEFDGLEILTRGFTNEYQDAVAASRARAARAYGGDTSRLPTALAKAITNEMLVKYVWLDVRGLNKRDGSPVTFAEFCAVVTSDASPDLWLAAFRAAGAVGKLREEAKADAAGNFAPASA